MDQEVHIHIDRNKLIAPICAGQMAAAFYSALILKKLEGKELTEDMREQTFHEVLGLWGALERSISGDAIAPAADNQP